MNATSQHLLEKWSPVLDFDGLDPIKDPYRRSVTAFLLENQERAIYEQAVAESGTFGLLSEVAPTVNTQSNAGGTVSGFTSTAADGEGRKGYDPILISMVRRAAPQMIAFDVCGVQPMSGPSGLVFYMKSAYVDPSDGAVDNEALFNEPDTAHSGTDTGDADTATPPADPFQGGSGVSDWGSTYQADTTGGMTTNTAEKLGESGGDQFREMTFAIESTTVTAKSRALKAEFTAELAQDLKAIHGLDAETELANILSTEILAEINREIIRTINGEAKVGARDNTATPGIYDMAVDSNGRWSVEKFKGLHFQIEREANAIAIETRRGRGNWIIASADVVAALSMTGNLDTGASAGAVGTGQLSPDGITGDTFVGTLNGRYKVYVDPYFVSSTTGASSRQYATVGYKGSSPYDAGLFYCPYVPLAMMKATGEQTFQPKIGFKTRYGILGNPFISNAANANVYFRKVDIQNLM